ncbi:acyltransferase family protein [Tunturiibacter lichenicola]|uniref:acyltransferase family protein n=1 Tax=Tunturiibacter lichenicola TaxID=2051959 RepID=UPI003D9B2C41
MNQAKRIVQLDGLRGIAVLMVFFSHAFRSQLLWTGVDLFFVLSGFLITGVLIEQRRRKGWSAYLASFYQRRMRRILPAYILFLGVTSILFGIGWMRRWYLFLFLMNTKLFLELDHRYSLGVLWSLAVEEQFYLVWPFVVYLLDEGALACLSGGLVLAAPLMRWIETAYYPGHWPIYSSTPFRMDLLTVGALIALVWRRNRTAVEHYGCYGLLLTGGAAIPLLLWSWYPWFQPAANSVLVNVWLYELSLIGYVGIVFWALSGRVVGFLKLRPLVYIGKISFSFYLIHSTILYILHRHLRHQLVGVAIAFAVSLLYAALTWHFLERPILQDTSRKPVVDSKDEVFS